MKQLYLILAFLSLTDFVTAQDSLSYRQQLAFQWLNDSTESKIDFGCGYVGSNSKNLYLLEELIAARRFDLISNLLDSRTASTRYLAISTLLYVDKQKVSKLSLQTRSKIDSLKNDSEMIVFCSGCTGNWTFSVKGLMNTKYTNKFKKKSVEYLNGWTKSWIKKGLK